MSLKGWGEIMKKKRVFISGITGTMGRSALKHLQAYKDQIQVVSIVRDSKKNRQFIKNHQDELEVFWGDLRDERLVMDTLVGVDMIVHLAALISPAADHHPQLAWEINVTSVEHILKAIQELELWDVELVYIGSVAETGSRLPPIHWGRVGDPIKASRFDVYAASKIAAERKVIESGLEKWVSLRQTGILHKGLLEMRDGIIYHQPLNNVLEWITEEDSGRLIANLCRKNLPNHFWKQVYNIGGGEGCRLNNYEFMSKMMGVLGIKDLTKVFEAKWFATQNFHGHYYLDSKNLNDILDFRRESVDDFMERMKGELQFPLTLLKYLPSWVIKKFIMKKIATQKGGVLYWIKHQDTEKINAFWGSYQAWLTILDWEELTMDPDYKTIKYLDHGYDESKDVNKLFIEDMDKVALFRGGRCVSENMIAGDLDSVLRWECAFKHSFTASPRLVLKTGHWCPVCEAPPWNYEEIARVNPFFKQVWES